MSLHVLPLFAARNVTLLAIAPPIAGLPGFSPSLTGFDRFAAWRGCSGRRYTVSIAELDDIADYDNAVALIVARKPSGQRILLRAVALGGTAAACDPGSLARLRGLGANEVHVHLLAADDAARRDIVADLG